MKLIDQVKPENFNEEPKNLVSFVNTSNLVEMISLYAFTTSSAMIFMRILNNHTFWTNIFKDRKLRCSQQGHKIDIMRQKLLFGPS